MKRMTIRWTALIAAMTIAMMIPAAAESGDRYVENEWNYVEAAMDISGGIPEDAEGGLARIREAGVLRVATEPYFPPQEFIDDAKTGQDRFVGSDMEMARLIARRMGVALEIVPMEFSEVLESVADGSCDLAISALAYTPGRAAKAELSKGYYYSDADAGCGLLIRAADAGLITGVDDLAERNITAEAGSLQETLMAENVRKYREFRRLHPVQQVYDAVEKGIADAAAVDIETAQAYIHSNPECGLTLVPDVRFALAEQFAGDRVAGKKGDTELVAFVNGVINELLDSGQYEAWFDQYAAQMDD